MPKKGTNPRGVEISNFALSELISHEQTNRIEIFWQRPEKEEVDIYEPFRRWVELWEEE